MTTVEITARNLKRLLAPVMPCAGTDADLPVLQSVQLQVRNGHLVAMATDRFRLAVCREELEGGTYGKDFEALVPTADLRHMLTVFKANRWHDPVLKLEVLAGGEVPHLRVTSGGVLDGLSGTAVTVALQGGKFPAVEDLLHKALEKEPPAEVGSFQPSFLADFKHAARDGAPLLVQLGKGREPAVVTCGTHFIGLIMPRRVGSGANDGSPVHQLQARGQEWRDVLAPKAVTA